MAYNIIADFFNIIDISLFNNATILLVICFIIWEIPRSVKILSEEYTEGLYPEGGRIVDLTLFVVGVLSIVFFMMGSNAKDTIDFLKAPGITAFLLVIMVVVPAIIILSFLKRFFARMEGNSVTVFLTQGFLDLMHTLFHIALVILFVPALTYLLFGGLTG